MDNPANCSGCTCTVSYLRKEVGDGISEHPGLANERKMKRTWATDHEIWILHMGDNWDDESSPYSSLFDTVFVTSQERHSVIWPI